MTGTTFYLLSYEYLFCKNNHLYYLGFWSTDQERSLLNWLVLTPLLFSLLLWRGGGVLPVGDFKEPDIHWAMSKDQGSFLQLKVESSSLQFSSLFSLLPICLSLLLSLVSSWSKAFLTLTTCFSSCLPMAQAELSNCYGPFGVWGRRFEFPTVECNHSKAMLYQGSYVARLVCSSSAVIYRRKGPTAWNILVLP